MKKLYLKWRTIDMKMLHDNYKLLLLYLYYGFYEPCYCHSYHYCAGVHHCWSPMNLHQALEKKKNYLFFIFLKKINYNKVSAKYCWRWKLLQLETVAFYRASNKITHYLSLPSNNLRPLKNLTFLRNLVSLPNN